MGRPRKRRHEEAEDTEDKDRNTGASIGKAVVAADVGVPDSDLAAFSGSGTGLEIDGLDFSGNNFEGHDIFRFGARDGESLPNTEAFSFDPPAGPASDLEQSFPDWDLSQDPSQAFCTFTDITPHSQIPLGASEELEGNNHIAENAVIGCSCLSSLYSMLAKFQSLPEPSFPFSMGALRSAAALSRGAVACHNCSKAYNTAIQNSMLLGLLLQLVIVEYAKLLKHIDEKSRLAEKLTFRFGDPSSLFDRRHTGLPDCPMAINVDLSGDEWRTLARKAVAQEVIGNSQSSRGLIGLVQDMRDRQASWREQFPKNQCVGLHGADHQRNAEGPGHVCVQVVYLDNLERSLEALGL